LIYYSFAKCKMANCKKCNNPPQLSVVLDCGCVFCFLCLKDYISIQSTQSTQILCICGQPLSIDIDHVSEDFRTTLNGLQGKPVWLYSSLSGDGWWMYNIETSDQLERCYSGGLPTCSFQIGSKTYSANFQGAVQSLISSNPANAKQREIHRVDFDNSIIEQINIKGIAGVYFKTIEDEIGKFV
jgi:hypothetical protein